MFNLICTSTAIFNKDALSEVTFKESGVYVGYIISPLTIRVEDPNSHMLLGVELDSGVFLDNFIPMPYDPLEDKVYEMTGIASTKREPIEDEDLMNKINQLLILKSFKHGIKTINQ